MTDIIYNNIDEIELKHLNEGDCFMYKYNLYMKIKPKKLPDGFTVLCINLSDGNTVDNSYIGTNTMVKPVDVDIIVK